MIHNYESEEILEDFMEYYLGKNLGNIARRDLKNLFQVANEERTGVSPSFSS